jgi:hypothetical protein
MSAVTVEGLTALRQRLAAAGNTAPLKETLRSEAEAIAEEARSAAPGDLGRSVEVVDVSLETRPAYAIGTQDPVGRFLEFGTVRRPASPWLLPVFRAHLPGLKDKLGKIVAAPLKRRAAAVCYVLVMAGTPLHGVPRHPIYWLTILCGDLPWR